MGALPNVLGNSSLISLMTLHTAKNTFKVRRIIAAMAAVTIPIIGIVGAQTAAAEPPKDAARATEGVLHLERSDDERRRLPHGNQWQ